MIFGITGTHEQPFDRLVRALDDYAAAHPDERVVIQRGYATYLPRHAETEAMYPQERMNALAATARVIVTHGGPGSIWLAFQHDRIPVVVPRMKRFGEHVDDHQVAFARHLERAGRAPAVMDIERLSDLLDEYASATSHYAAPTNVAVPNRAKLCAELEGMLTRSRS